METVCKREQPQAVRTPGKPWRLPGLLVPGSIFLTEAFAYAFLGMEQAVTPWPLAFGLLWAILLGGLLYLLPRQAARAAYGIVYGLPLLYTVIQTGYYYMFSEMMWLSEFRYASEGADYLDVLASYPVLWYLSVLAMSFLGVLVVWRFPKWDGTLPARVGAAALAVLAALGAWLLPEWVFLADGQIRYAGSDYGRAQSAEAAYDNMFNAHRLYQVCGIHQTVAKDVYTHFLYPLTPGYASAQEAAEQEVTDYFQENGKFEKTENEMTGIFRDKNVVMVLMESMDDWLLGEHTPTINFLMETGINFTNFYTPPSGGIRTFNTEFCINTGSFLSSAGGYAFDYVTNHFYQSLPYLLSQEAYGYTPRTFHYNDPSFYSRGVFSPAMGYEDYVFYGDYAFGTEKEIKDQLYDDKLLFTNEGLKAEFFENEKFFNFIITRSAHLSYKYNEVLSYWGLKQYPEYKGLTGHEELDCAYLKAKLVDDMFACLLKELEERGLLENTIIVGVTDHYTYGFKDLETLYEVSNVDDALWLERTPCFIWSADTESMVVDKTLNTSDLVPTLLNLLGVEAQAPYMGSDAFDPDYAGYAPFSDGSWVSGDVAWNASTRKMLYRSDAEPVTSEFQAEMTKKVQEFTRINNLILDTDYYERYAPEE